MIEKIHSIYIKNYLVSTDSRNIVKNSIFFALKGENFDANEFAEESINKGAMYAVVDNKKYQTKDNILLVDDVLSTLQELAAYHREQINIPILALTGSNGKTTTKELIYTVLNKKFITTATKGNFNNHIGVPLTLLSMTKETEIGIVEMGANHPKEIEFLCNIIKPDYGYITNFGKAHLEGFGSIEGVIKAKTELYTYLKKNNKIAFVNANDKIQVKKSVDIETINFGNGSDVSCKMIGAAPFVKIQFNDLDIQSNLIGSYNATNIMAAIAIGNHFNVSKNKIKEALEIFYPKNNRSQLIKINTTKVILDAYNANPTSITFALESFSNLNDTNKIVILGDMFEVGKHSKVEHQNITEIVSKGQWARAYLIGENFKDTKTSNKSVHIYPKYSDFVKEFDKSLFENASVLIKASRGMSLERILDLLKK